MGRLSNHIFILHYSMASQTVATSRTQYSQELPQPAQHLPHPQHPRQLSPNSRDPTTTRVLT